MRKALSTEHKLALVGMDDGEHMAFPKTKGMEFSLFVLRLRSAINNLREFDGSVFTTTPDKKRQILNVVKISH